jgi:UDP-N-acetylglucosamine acyltransferase
VSLTEPAADTLIHPTSLVAAGARLGPGTRVGPYAIVEDETDLGPGCEVRAHAVVKRYARLGEANVVYEGAVVGGEPQDLSFQGGPSGLRLGDRNTLREGVTIHRANKPGGETTLGSDCFLMAYVHVAHDCHVGDRVIMANNVALAGHVSVGDRAFLSGGVVVHQFCRVGRLAMVGGTTKAVQDCLPFVITDGHPARARGLNVVGLRRAGLTASQIRVLRQGYRLLLRSSLPLAEALERMAALGDPLVDELAEFARSAKRGFHRARRGEADAAE